MCGICGIFDLNGLPIDPAVLGEMTEIIRHRGPDGDGQYVDREVGLGHRRLSIIDLGGGAQPIGNEDGKLQIVFNGEIYNFVELRAELESFGHKFKTRSDTEVIVHAYEQWGADCVRRFNGMFAFALWDGHKRELFLARDHLGIKPLYHVTIGSKLVFASEIKCLLLHPGCPRELDPESLAELFTFRYVPSPKTLFKGIAKVPPGYAMHCARTGVKVNRFWDWIPKHREDAREPELIEEYQSLLEDAVKLQLRSDVPLGLFLSSGVDSGALLAIMRNYSSGPVQTFTIGFEGGERTNEIEDARVTAKQYGVLIGDDGEHKRERCAMFAYSGLNQVTILRLGLIFFKVFIHGILNNAKWADSFIVQPLVIPAQAALLACGELVGESRRLEAIS
jgi:asparagine synthase (glutamine-hydrolysing)